MEQDVIQSATELKTELLRDQHDEYWAGQVQAWDVNAQDYGKDPEVDYRVWMAASVALLGLGVYATIRIGRNGHPSDLTFSISLIALGGMFSTVSILAHLQNKNERETLAKQKYSEIRTGIRTILEQGLLTKRKVCALYLAQSLATKAPNDQRIDTWYTAIQ